MRKIINKVLLILILINFIYVFSGMVHYPLRSIDVYSIWLFKAKAFFVYGGFPIDFLSKHLYSHPHYPILLPWFFSLIYKSIGEVNEYAVLAIYPFVYLSILVIAYKLFIKMKLTKTQSLFFVYLYSMLSPLLAQGGRYHAGSADIVLTLFYWLAIYIIFEIPKKKYKSKIILITLITWVTSQIKLEGVFLVWFLLFMQTERSKKIFWTIIATLPAVFWYIARIQFDIPKDFGFVIPSMSIAIQKLFIVIIYTTREMFNIKNWYIFWIVFWILMFIQKSKDSFVIKRIIPSLVMMTIMYILVYISTDLDTKAHVSSSIDRVMLQLSPFFFVIFVHKIKVLFEKIIESNSQLWSFFGWYANGSKKEKVILNFRN